MKHDEEELEEDRQARCGSATCTAAQYCQWRRVNRAWVGTCVAKLAAGKPCSRGWQCVDGDCRRKWVKRGNYWRIQGRECYKPPAGTCDKNSQCTSAQFCNWNRRTRSGKCETKWDAGKPCGSNTRYRCKSGRCKRGWKKIGTRWWLYTCA